MDTPCRVSIELEEEMQRQDAWDAATPSKAQIHSQKQEMRWEILTGEDEQLDEVYNLSEMTTHELDMFRELHLAYMRQDYKTSSAIHHDFLESRLESMGVTDDNAEYQLRQEAYDDCP